MTSQYQINPKVVLFLLCFPLIVDVYEQNNYIFKYHSLVVSQYLCLNAHVELVVFTLDMHTIKMKCVLFKIYIYYCKVNLFMYVLCLHFAIGWLCYEYNHRLYTTIDWKLCQLAPCHAYTPCLLRNGQYFCTPKQ